MTIINQHKHVSAEIDENVLVNVELLPNGILKFKRKDFYNSDEPDKGKLSTEEDENNKDISIDLKNIKLRLKVLNSEEDLQDLTETEDEEKILQRETFIFLTPLDENEEEGVYREWIWTGKEFESLGSTTTDIDNYIQKVKVVNNLEETSTFNENDPKVLSAQQGHVLKEMVEDVDNTLSTTSIKPVQNKIIKEALDSKVDKDGNKVLSTNDFTNEFKTKLEGISSGANSVNVSDSIDDDVTDPVQGKVIKKYVDDMISGSYEQLSGGLAGYVTTDDLTTDLTNYIKKTDVIDNLNSEDTQAPLSAKQGHELNVAISGKANASHMHNKSDIQNFPTIVNDLHSEDGTNSVLSANQGRILKAEVDNKIDKVVGKGLSTYDYNGTAKSIVEGVSSTYATKEELQQAVIDGTVDLSGYLKKTDTISSEKIIDDTPHAHIGSAANATQSDINLKMNSAISNKQISLEEIGGNNSYAQRYQIKQGGSNVGNPINIPRDFLIESVTLETCTTNDEPEQGYLKNDKYFDFVIRTQYNNGTTHIYVNVRNILTDGTIVRSKLSDELNTALTELDNDNKDLYDALVEFDRVLSIFNGASDQVEGDLAHLADALATFMDNLTSFSGPLEGYKDDLNDTQEGLKKLKDALDAFQGALTDFNGDLDEFKTKLLSQGLTAADITAMSDEIGILFNIMYPLQSQIDESAGDITDLQSSTATMEGHVDNIKESLYGDKENDSSNYTDESLMGLIDSSLEGLGELSEAQKNVKKEIYGENAYFLECTSEWETYTIDTSNITGTNTLKFTIKDTAKIAIDDIKGNVGENPEIRIPNGDFSSDGNYSDTISSWEYENARIHNKSCILDNNPPKNETYIKQNINFSYINTISFKARNYNDNGRLIVFIGDESTAKIGLFDSINTVNSDIFTLQTQADEYAQEVSGITENVDTITTEVNRHTQEMNGITENINSVNSNINTVNSNINTVNSNIGTVNKTDGGNLQNQIATLLELNHKLLNCIVVDNLSDLDDLNMAYAEYVYVKSNGKFYGYAYNVKYFNANGTQVTPTSGTEVLLSDEEKENAKKKLGESMLWL